MKTNYQQLRYGWRTIKTTLEAVQNTVTDVLSDLETDDDRWAQVFKALSTDMERWKQSIDRNIEYCREQEQKEGKYEM